MDMHYRLSLSFIFTSFLLLVGFTTTAAGQNADDHVSVLTNEVAKANNQSLLWGPYKPNLYFGLHPRIPKSLSAGLMWAKVDNFATAQESQSTRDANNSGPVSYES
jgi:mannosyl-oligosaccharide glucosidase